MKKLNRRIATPSPSSTPYSLRRPASTPYFHPFFNFSGFPLPLGGNQNSLPLLWKRGWMVPNYDWYLQLLEFTKDFFVYEVYMKIFLLFTVIYSKINLNECCGINFAVAIICQHTLEKIQISLSKSLSSCWLLRRILKAV